ncbi:MAG: methyl-accepting chemotaxis protein [Deltaproteobacteria bacterium]|nr:methyl-accepting chemotaxis protein [Deltaproteobacteria bacterium]
MANSSRLLERAFKIRFGLKLCLFTLIGGAAVVLLLYFSLARSLGDSYGSAIYTIHELKIRVLPLIFASSYSILVLGLVTVAIAVISVLFSHRIAGPLFRLEKNLDAIASGDLTVNTRFRGMDQLSVLADELNTMVRSLNHVSRSVMDSAEELRAAEEALRSLLEMEAPPEAGLKDATGALRAAIEKMSRAVSAIKVKD